jgi:hypothetical protein
MTAEAAERLRRDWYYRHAVFKADGGAVVMCIPDTDPGTILPLCRWLGTEAELLGPAELRERLKQELEAARRVYG